MIFYSPSRLKQKTKKKMLNHTGSETGFLHIFPINKNIDKYRINTNVSVKTGHNRAADAAAAPPRWHADRRRRADGQCSGLAVRRAGTRVPCGTRPGSQAHVLCTTRVETGRRPDSLQRDSAGARPRRRTTWPTWPYVHESLRRGLAGMTRESCRQRRRFAYHHDMIHDHVHDHNYKASVLSYS